ncbi:sugar dehydrogenase complex small subunit [Pantoea eucrina]|uniref:Sorbitol dehydrogenase family protein n=1 Tax=Pantoea eucrina TaxID=472693 RepID=A0ABU5LJX5_9GAMM|nr:sugar dehydrogenase complex small subunit [Pantoea eucrina]MDZ7280011.1 sorbitol dehydrogenase family protein [Pantoea eucrina]
MHYSRRRALKLIGLVTLTSAAGQFLALPRLKAAQSSASPAALNDFLQVSRLLTQQDELSTAVAQALLLALDHTHPGFVSALMQLKNLLQRQPALLQQDRLTFSTADAESEKLAQAILGGWYNGVVGKGKGARYVTYVNTLAAHVVSDKLVPPSFSYGRIGSWAQQP